MLGKLTACFFVIASFLALSNTVNAQLPDYKALAEYIMKERGSPDATRIIVEHLEQTATTEPLEELIRWTNADFPELRNKDGSWNTMSDSIYLCIVSSINYFFTVSPPPEKGKIYLETIERLRKNGTIVYHLTQSAFKILNEQELEEEFFRLIDSADADERAGGLNLGRNLAEKNRDIFNVYAKILKQDKNAQVRNTALHVLGTIRRNYSKEIALLALEQLLVDDNVHVKEIASVIVKQGADGQSGWTEEDSTFLLLQMLKTNDSAIRKTIGITVVKLTTVDKSLNILEDKIPENLFDEIVEQVKSKQNELKRNLEADELLIIWKEWWTPKIPKYTRKSNPIACD